MQKQINFYTKLTLLFLSSAGLMSNLAVSTVMPHLKDYFSDANIEFYSRLMITAPALLIALLSPLIGYYVSKIGKKKSAIFGLLIFILCGSAGMYLNSIETMLASRFALGIGISIIMIVSTSLTGDYFQGEERHNFIGLQNIFISGGGIVFVVIGGFLADIFWRLPFAVYLLGVLLIPAIYINIFDIEKKDFQANIKMSKALKLTFIIAFLYMAVYFILAIQIPFLVMNVYEKSAKFAGFVVGISFFASSLGALFFVKLKKRFEFIQIFIFSLFVLGIGMLFIGFVKNAYFLFITSFVVGFGGGIAMTNFPAWMLSHTNVSQRVRASSYLTSAFFLGQFFSPFFTQPFIKFFGLSSTFMIFGVMLIFISIVFFLKK